MEKQKTTRLTKEQLKGCSKSILVDLAYGLQEQVADLNSKLDLLTERINVLTGEQFGRQSETKSALDELLERCANEAEVLMDSASEEDLKEPELFDINPKNTSERKSHPKGTRAALFRELPTEDIPHELKGADLIHSCGGRLHAHDTECTQRLAFHPAAFVLENHIVHSYRCSRCGETVYADRPLSLFPGSLASSSLLGGIANAKFTNAVPYDRLEKSFEDNNAFLSRQTMARWMIRASEEYLSLLYDRLKKELLTNDIIHADETTVVVSKDGRKAGAKSYMWVYTSHNSSHPVVIYEYQKTRAGIHPKEFLKDFHGWLCCDGYEAYHSLNDDITVCGCWAHSRRHFSNAVKGLQKIPKRSQELTISEEALQRIGEMFHLTGTVWADLPREEQEKLRNTELKEKLDSYFSWVESVKEKVPPKSETGKGLTYSLNQKKYLLGVLTNPDIPMDNSEAERKIRNFVISRKNFVTIDTLSGAEASAVMFSIAETLRANGLKSYEYFKYLFEEIPKHMDDNSKDLSFLDDLLPWSEKLPAELHKPKK